MTTGTGAGSQERSDELLPLVHVGELAVGHVELVGSDVGSLDVDLLVQGEDFELGPRVFFIVIRLHAQARSFKDHNALAVVLFDLVFPPSEG